MINAFYIKLIRTILLSMLMLFVYSGAEAELQPSSIPGIMVAEGYDAEIFSTGLTLPVQLALEPTGNILVASNCINCPVLRLSPTGDVIAISSPIYDPDGIAVDSFGQVFVAGGGKITIAFSLDGGTNEIFTTGFSNLNNIAIDSKDRIVVSEDDGRIREVTNTGLIIEPPLIDLSFIGNALAFDDVDRLFVGGVNSAGGFGELYRVDYPDVNTLISDTVNPMVLAIGRNTEFGAEIYVADYYNGNIQKVEEETGTLTHFAYGLNSPHGLVFDSTNALLVAEMNLGKIIRIFPILIEVEIDIKPGSFPNSINLDSKGTVPVAIFSTTTFDATTVEPTSVTLACAPIKLKGKGTPMASFEDVNEDGLLDQIIHIETEALQLNEASEVAILEGKTIYGTPIKGIDTIKIVP